MIVNVLKKGLAKKAARKRKRLLQNEAENKTTRLYEMNNKIREALDKEDVSREKTEIGMEMIETAEYYQESVTNHCEIWLNRSPVAETMVT